MRTTSTWIVVALVSAVGCTYERPLTYTEPPVGSYTTGTFKVRIGDTVTSLQGATVAAEFFGAARIQPLLGRFFIDADQRLPATRVVVLSHDLWAQHFASSPSILGREIELDGRQATVVGVAPRGFRFPDGTLLWTPRGGGER